MPRAKRTNVKRFPPIDLDMDNPEHLRLWSYYQEKTSTGQGATWIVKSLLLSLPAQSSASRIKPKSELQYIDVEE